MPSPSGTPRALELPDSFDGHVRSTDPESKRLIDEIRRSRQQTAPEFAAKAKIAIYHRRENPQRWLIFIGLSGRDSRQVAGQLRSTPPSVEVDQALKALPVTGLKAYPAGPLGGALHCGSGSPTGAACAWADTSTLGVTMDHSASPADLARTTLALRNAAER